MVFIGFSVTFLLSFRIFVAWKFCDNREEGYQTVYVGLFLYPLLLAIQAILGGLLCMSSSVEREKENALSLTLSSTPPAPLSHW
jgi:hypothetical protein